MNALLKAAHDGHEACVRVLIAAQADLAYADSDGWSILHCAASTDHASICRVLVDEGASLTAVDRLGQTSLEMARRYGRAECVVILEVAAATAAIGGAV